jgi:hypothetical protein
MLAELNEIGSEDAATKWAHRRLKEKNKLNEADAKHVEEAFRAKLLSFAIHTEGFTTTEGGKNKRKSPPDKSVLTHPEPRRVRDREPVRFVAQQTCLVCGRQPCDAHHLALRKTMRSAARSATSLRSRSAEDIIARSIATAMKPGGGRNSGSIRTGPHARYGSPRTRNRNR